MKKVLFLISFFLFTAANNWLVGSGASVVAAPVAVVHDDFGTTEMPMGEGEEKSGEEDKDFTEDDDTAGLHHLWMSRDKSFYAGLHFLYQEILFNNLEFEIVIPPPEA